MNKWTRRGFIAAGTTLGAGFVLGVGLLARVDTTGLDGAIGGDGVIRLNAWIEILPDGKIRFAVPRAEMGQGVHTALPMLMAEELEIPLDPARVTVVHPTELLPVYTNFVAAMNKRPEEAGGPLDWAKKKAFALIPLILTGGSSSIADGYHMLRVAGASARLALIAAAAEQWGVAPDTCRAEKFRVLHPASGRSLDYGALAAAAAARTPVSDPPLKSPDQFRLIGTPQPRLDIPAKTRGAAMFGIDTVLPNMLVATVVHSPVLGGKLKSFDPRAALAMRGVKQVVGLGDSVGVIAETYYHARKAADALVIDWDEAGQGGLSTESIFAGFRQAMQSDKQHVFRDDGKLDAAFAGAALIDATYETPYLAHACMEPMNATALYQDKAFEIWIPSQSPTIVKFAVQKVLSGAAVTIHTTLSGGGFGRRAEGEFARQAAALAMAMPGIPVKLVWSREQDIQHDSYRPAAIARMRASLGADGNPTGFEFAIGTQSPQLSFSTRSLPFQMGGDSDGSMVEGAAELPYDIPNVRVRAATAETVVPTGFWRSVGHSNTGFFIESFFDELAHAAKADPLQYRRRLFGSNQRLVSLIDLVAAKSDWQQKLDGPGRARGVSLHSSFRSHVAQVAEVTVGPNKTLKVERVICAVDCGQVVNPDTVTAQMEGAIIFALSALMYGEITIDKGRVVQSNFDSYDMVRLAQTPAIEVHIVPSRELPGGIGEPGTPPLFAAVTNAIFAATGQRIRKLPLAAQGFTLV